MSHVLHDHRWLALLLAVLVAAGSLLISDAATAEDLEDHPHMLVLGFEADATGPTGYRRCVDLAANRHVPLHAHHDHLHDEDGRASQAQRRAGNVVVPGAPLTPWADCEALIAFFFPDEE